MSSSVPSDGEFVSPIRCPPGSVVVVTCYDDHQKMKDFLVKHPTGANLGNLDLEDVDKEILRTSVTYIRPGGILLLSQFFL